MTRPKVFRAWSCCGAVIAIAAGLLALHASSLAAPGAGCGNPLTVTIDIGHTPERPGAISARGKTEYQFNRALALDLAEALQARKATVHILNEVGNEISLGGRSARLAAVSDGIILSLHHDSVQPRYLERQVVDGRVTRFTRYPKARGYSLFVSGRSPAYAASERLASTLGGELRRAGFTPSMHHAEPIKGENRPVLDARLGVFRYDALMVLKGAHVPAVLFEAGVIVNPEEELELESAARKARVVSALVEGISAFCRQVP